MADKVVRKIHSGESSEPDEGKTVTDEQLANELGYILGRKMIDEMLEKGLISQAEFNQIEQKNRDTFRPHLVDLLPGIT